MALSEKLIKDFQKIFKEEYNKDLDYDEAEEAGRNLVNLFNILFDIHIRELKLKEKLKDSPRGFSLMDGQNYSCGICGNYIKDEQLWYDKWGKKCLACQEAIDKKIVPGVICRKDELWYSIHDFNYYFELKSPSVKKLVRLGVLKARIVPQTNFHIFILEENIDVLPPKDLLKSVSRPSEENDGLISIIPWYEVYNPKKVLGKYKIWPYLSYFNSN